jgi:hypothetical protein
MIDDSFPGYSPPLAVIPFQLVVDWKDAFLRLQPVFGGFSTGWMSGWMQFLRRREWVDAVLASGLSTRRIFRIGLRVDAVFVMCETD